MNEVEELAGLVNGLRRDCASTRSGSSSTRRPGPSPPKPPERSAYTSTDQAELHARTEADSEKHPPQPQAEIGCRSTLPGKQAACTEGVGRCRCVRGGT